MSPGRFGKEMLVRTIHHLAATGGTLMSKCLAAQPRVCLVSEINPTGAAKVVFAPTNLVSQFIGQYPKISKQLRVDYFQQQVRLLLTACRDHNRQLVIRDHSHSDYICRNPRRPGALRTHLSGYTVRSVITIRDPIDSFLSSLPKNWVKGVNNDLDLYCRRILDFVDDLSDSPVFRYEDFCVDPLRVVREMCLHLDLEFSEKFINTFSEIRLTGDSGRSSPNIELRPRRKIPDAVIDAARKSKAYEECCSRFGYLPVFAAPRVSQECSANPAKAL